MKRQQILFFLFVVGAICTLAFRPGPDVKFAQPVGWPEPAYDFGKNPLSQQRIELGRALFYDPVLSRDSTISCASCHSPYTAFAHVDHDLSHGIDNKIGTRNAPALVNLAWGQLFMWDGAINHLDMQSLFPITHPLEMDEKIEHVASKLQRKAGYPQLFYMAYGDSVVTGEHMLKAISQFMLTLVSANSKYDSVVRKEAQFTAQEENGYKLFKQNCAACHKEPLFTNQQFENNGLTIDTGLRDWGRMKVSRNPADSLKFKVPTLRNIEFSYPYMHDGRFKHLGEVLKHYAGGINHGPTLSVHLQQPLSLSSNDRVDLTAFLLTLTDRHFLFDTTHTYPRQIFKAVAKDK
jgi:cytochrome c peroxidase